MIRHGVVEYKIEIAASGAAATLSIDNPYISFDQDTGELCFGNVGVVNVTASAGNSWVATRSGTNIFVDGSSTASGTGNGSFTVTMRLIGASTFHVDITSSAPTVTVNGGSGLCAA